MTGAIGVEADCRRRPLRQLFVRHGYGDRGPERERDKARTIKQGMMQELLTGRIRLVEPPFTPYP